MYVFFSFINENLEIVSVIFSKEVSRFGNSTTFCNQKLIYTIRAYKLYPNLKNCLIILPF